MALYVKRAAVIGAGVMGAGIAALLTGIGVDTLLIDIVPDQLNEDEAKKGLTFESKAVRNRFANAAKERMRKDPAGFYEPKFAALMTTGNLEDDLGDLADCDLVIEAVVEDIGIKRALMGRLSEVVREDCMVASNTSGLPISDIASGLPQAFRRQFLGAHFFNPPRFMRLLELIPTVDTDPDVLRAAREFFETRLGKSVIIAKDVPGFVGNRIGIHATGVILNCAQAYGYDVSKVDALTGKTLGRANTATFKTADLVGIDLIQRVSITQSAKLSDPLERDEQKLPSYIAHMVEQGLCGNKTGKGFYAKEKTEDGVKRFVYNIQSGAYDPQPAREEDAAFAKGGSIAEWIYGDSEESHFLWDVTKRMLLNCSRRIPEISDDYRQIDIAMRHGFNWQWGPFELWDKIGLVRAVNRMRAEGEEIPDWIAERAAGEIAFYPAQKGTRDDKHALLQTRDASVFDLQDGVLWLTFTTKANSLTAEVADTLTQAIDLLERGDYRGLVIKNEGQNFCVGANLFGILDLCRAGEWKQLEEAVVALQNGFMRLKYSKKPVIAAPHGMTLGGGTELVLHAPAAVAHVETYMGLVEAGVGLIPAGGGTKECLFQAMEGFTDRPLAENISRVIPAFETIAMGKVSANAHHAKSMGLLAPRAHTVMNADLHLNAAKAEAIHRYEMGYLPRVPSTIQATGMDGYAALAARVTHLLSGGFITEYDAHIAKKLAYVMTGGAVFAGDELTEAYVLDLEREAFLSLCGEQKTQDRIAYMVKTGKPLRN